MRASIFSLIWAWWCIFSDYLFIVVATHSFYLVVCNIHVLFHLQEANNKSVALNFIVVFLHLKWLSKQILQIWNILFLIFDAFLTKERVLRCLWICSCWGLVIQTSIMLKCFIARFILSIYFRNRRILKGSIQIKWYILQIP